MAKKLDLIPVIFSVSCLLAVVSFIVFVLAGLHYIPVTFAGWAAVGVMLFVAAAFCVPMLED